MPTENTDNPNLQSPESDSPSSRIDEMFRQMSSTPNEVTHRDDDNDEQDNDSFVCCQCQDETNLSLEREDERGNPICEDCYDETCFECEYCSDVFNRDNAYGTNGNGQLCEDCFHEEYFHCQGCGEPHHLDNVCHDEYGDEYYCEYCWDDNSAYHDWTVWSNQEVAENNNFVNPRQDRYCLVNGTMVKSDDMTNNKDSFSIIPSKRYMGAEIECNDDGSLSYSDMRRGLNSSIDRTRLPLTESELEADRPSFRSRTIDVTSDGSITDEENPYGFEYVFVPRRGDIQARDYKTTTEFLKASNGSYISHRCGYHLHIDTRDYDWYHFAVLTLMVKLIEPHIYSWVAPSRRLSRWCAPVSQRLEDFGWVRDRDSFMEFYYDNGAYRNEKYHDKRYHGYNLHSHFQANAGTELRYHSGTLNPDKMIHWSIVWGQIIDKCYEMSETMKLNGAFDDKLSSSKFLTSLITPNVKGFDPETLKSLNKHFNGRVGIGERDRTNISEYRDMSASLSRALGFKNQDGIYRVDCLINKLLQAKTQQPCLTMSNMFDVFDIPSKTRQFYLDRVAEIDGRDRRGNNGLERREHIANCYSSVSSFCEFDPNIFEFKYVDWLEHRMPKLDDLDGSYYDSWSRNVLVPTEIADHIQLGNYLT